MENPGQGSPLSIEQMAQQHADEILARRQVARETRAAVLDIHPSPISVTTDVSKMRLADAVMAPLVKGGVKVDQCGGAKGSHYGSEKYGGIAGARTSGA
jgi:hypothetical protein